MGAVIRVRAMARSPAAKTEVSADAQCFGVASVRRAINIA